MTNGQRLALVVAVDHYEHSELGHLAAPAADAEALAAVLSAPELGGFDVSVLHNESSWEVGQRVEDLLASRTPSDVVLLHFSCHGLKDDTGELHLAAPNTNPQRLASTSTESTWLYRQIRRSRAQLVLLLLDCCYAGAFEKGLVARSGSAIDVDQARQASTSDGRGRAVITASTAMEYAFEGSPSARDTAGPSVFTQALVSGIESGEADRDQDGQVSLDELYEYVYEHVRAATPAQTPGKWEFDLRGDVCIARNPRHKIVPAPLPSDITDMIEQSNATVRCLGVNELERLAGSTDLTLAAGARQALEHLQADDSRRVSLAATAAWDATSVRLPVEVADLGLVGVGEEQVVGIPVDGGPLAAASSADVNNSSVRVTLDGETLQVGWTPLEPTRLDAEVTLSGPAGEARLRLVGVAATDVPTASAVGPTPRSAPATASHRLTAVRQPAGLPLHFPATSLESVYLDGCAAAEHKAWPKAIAAFERVSTVDASYRDTPARLAHARAAFDDANQRRHRHTRQVRSTWLLGPLLGASFLTWASFLYIGLRARHRPWLIAAAGYAIALAFVIFGLATSHGPTSGLAGAAVAVLLAVWIGGFVHALTVNRQYLDKLEARTRLRS